MAINPYGLYEYSKPEPQGDKAATPEEFRPKYSKKQLDSVINAYKRNPKAFNQEQIDSIKQHAIYHNTGFYEGDFQITEAIKQFMGGIFEGFTTLPVTDAPDNEYEALAKNIGHLLGFAPGLAAKPLKLLGLRNTAAQIAGWKSIPLGVGEKATEITGKALRQFVPTAKANATGTVAKFLTSGATKSVLEESMKLGVASAVSNWKQGVDGIVMAAKSGAEFGGAFQILANMVPGTGPFKYLLRATAGSIYQGMHAEAAGATTPEKVYEYLLGAYFGGGSAGWVQKSKSQFFKERNEQMYGTKGKKADHKAQATGDPTLIKTWDKYEPIVQKEIIRELNDPDYYGKGKPSENWRPQHKLEEGQTYPERTAMLEHIVKQMGIDTKAEVVSDNGWARFLRMQEDAVLGRKPTNLALRTEKELIDLNAEKKQLAERIQKLNADATVAKSKDKILIDTEVNTISNRLKAIEAREQKLLDLKPFEFLNKENEPINERLNDDGNDIGMISSRDLSRKSETLVEKHMKELWNKDEFDPIDVRNEKLRLTALVDDIVAQDKYVGKDKKVDTRELVEEIKAKIKADHNVDIKISKNTENELRQYLTRANFGNHVKYINVTVDNEGKISPLEYRQDGFTMAGNRKASIEPKKEVQQILEELTGLKEKTPEAAVLLDNLTFRGPKGEWKDGTLSDVRDLISNVKGRKKDEAQKLYESMLKQTHEQMAEKGYYPFGGKGDNDIIIYMKEHPLLKDVTATSHVRSYLTSIENKQNSGKYLEQALNRNKFFTKDIAKKHYISNIMWDISLNGFKPKTRNEYKEALDKLFFGEGYIKNATAWNKRQQIWFTPAYRADGKFIYDNYQRYARRLSKADQALINPDFTSTIADGKVNYAIVRDLDPALFDKNTGKRIKKLDKDSKNTDMDEHVDGMIIAEDSVLKAIIKDSGMPQSGQNKSFIVSPDSKLGALLGKYMIHSAGPKASRQMREAGLHMIMQESAVKQRGERGITDYNIKKDKLEIDDPNLIYKLPLEHIKYSYSVKNDNAMIGLNPDGSTHRHGIPKQLLMAMGQNTHSKFPKDLIDDFYAETVYKKYAGKKEINEIYEDYKNNPNSKKLLRMLEDNVENLGVEQLLDAINDNPTNFTDSAYMRLMKIQKNDLKHRVADGELTADEAERLTQNIEEFNSSMDRIVEAGKTWKTRENLLGREGNINPLLLHKWIRPYRFQVIRNYVFNSLSRPKIDNSGVARMRGYDKWFQEDAKFKDIQKNDEVFYLDDSFKKMPLKTTIKNYEDTTLGELWFKYTNKKNPFGKAKKELAERVFTALTVRVPMDSVSGAQKMHFKGFTGRPGHGILMHGRAMKAEGGADLDGDESFIFFGGREGEKGGGFRQRWIKKFHENKEEFYEADGTIFNNKNDAAVKSLTMQDSKATTGIDPKSRDSKMWQYDSQWRQDISERAVDGRNLLGGAVSGSQIIKAAHNSINALPGKKNTFMYYDKSNKGKVVVIEARTDDAELKKARQLASSMIAFTSDPLDVAGLTGYKDYVGKLTDAYFKIELDGKPIKAAESNNLDIVNSKEGLLGQMRDVNSALYSRDYYNNKSWDAIDIAQKTSVLKDDSISDLSKPETHNNMLAKIGRLASDVELYDSPFRMVNPERLTAMYDEYNNIASKIPMFKDLLANVKVKQNKLAMKIMKEEAYERKNLERIVDNLPEFYEYINHPQSMFKPGGSSRDKFSSKIAEYSRPYRTSKLKELIKFAEDTLSQDVSDMVTVRQAYRYYDGVEVNPIMFRKILKQVNNLKSNSWLQRKSLREEDILRQKSRGLDKIFGLKEMELPQKTATLDQAKMDIEIAAARRSMPNPRARKIFDMMMLGTFRHSSMETGVNKLGFSSKAISGDSLADFVGDFTQVMNKAYISTPIDKKLNDTIFKDITLEKDLPEGTILEDTTTGYEGLHGKPDMKLIPKQVRQELSELVGTLKEYNGKIGQNLNEVVRGVLGKDFNALDYGDLKNLNRYFRELQNGTIWQRLFKEKTPDLRKRYTMQFPLTINRETMKYDIALMKKRGLFMTQAGDIASGRILKPTQYTELLHHGISLSMDKAQAKGDEEVFKLRRSLEFLDGVDEGEAFRMLAVREIEADGNVSRSLGRSDKVGNIRASNYIKDLKNIRKELNYDAIRNNRYRITERDLEGKVKRVEYTGEELIKRTKDTYKKFFKDMHTNVIRGNKKLLDNYHKKDKFGRKKYHDMYDYKSLKDPVNGGKRKTPMEPMYDVNRFIEDVYEAYERGQDITTDIGIDGIRAMARSMMIQLHHKYAQKYLSKEDFRKKIGLTLPTGDLSDGYWPHMLFDKKLAGNALNNAAEKINKSKMTKEAKKEELRKLQLRSRTLTGDWLVGTEDWEAYDSETQPKRFQADNRITWKESLQMTSSMHKRTSHIPGHSIDATVPEVYARNMYKTYYKQLAQMLSRKTLYDFDMEAFKKGWHKQYTPGSNLSLKDRWHNWYSLYVQDSLGHPSVVPEYMMKDPGMKIKGTPYAWWADNNVTKKMNSVAKKLGIKGPFEDKFSLDTIRHWSNMEARLQLMALLAHPKSMITNLFGGSLHTIQSAGAPALKKVYDYGFLKQINPDFTSRQKILDFAIKQGVFPEMLAHEWGMQNKLQGTKSKSFIKDVVENISKEGTVDMNTMRQLREKHGVGEGVMQFAAKFMSKPEMKLRTDAFMAHYIKAWERFGGAITQHDHPFLIEMAKRGVKATQFLYDSVNRPAFARTGLGKILTRFQLWSWNAWRFRNDVNREARIRGYRQGTPQYEKFKRTAQIDLLVYALGGVFAFSLFENAIPAPYNHLKETSEWLFGDDKEREKAFWGLYPRSIAPLQAITPPTVSKVIEGLKAMSNNDYEKFLDYHIYTMFPFGRMARDFSPWAKGNLVDNPSRVIEKMTGIPIGALQRERNKFKDSTAYHPTFQTHEQLRDLLED